MSHAVDPVLIVQIHRVNHQSVSLPMPYRVSHPQGAETGVMLAAVGINLTPDGVVLEEHDDLARPLNNLHGQGVSINPRHAGWNTVVVNGVVCFPDGKSVSSKRGLGAFVLGQAPSGHGRPLLVE